MSEHAPVDANGQPIPANEKPGTVVKVWEIRPEPPMGEYDHYVFRDYHKAEEFAGSALEYVMEQAALGQKVSVTCQIIEMTKGRYLAIVNQQQED